jgi:hypothetical protein
MKFRQNLEDGSSGSWWHHRGHPLSLHPKRPNLTWSGASCSQTGIAISVPVRPPRICLKELSKHFSWFSCASGEPVPRTRYNVSDGEREVKMAPRRLFMDDERKTLRCLGCSTACSLFNCSTVYPQGTRGIRQSRREGTLSYVSITINNHQANLASAPYCSPLPRSLA